jgi:serine/threonine protein kinase/WD40 repeat protein
MTGAHDDAAKDRDPRSQPDATLPPGSVADELAFTLASGEGDLPDPEATLPPEVDTATLTVPDVSRQFGDYELLEEIARGGMGVVFKARQISIDRVVALKMILAGQLASEAQVQRFHTEAKAAGNLDHPNIVPIYEVNRHDGHIYYSMKFVEGCSLGQLLTDLRDRRPEGQPASSAGHESGKLSPPKLEMGVATYLLQHQSDSARLISSVARAIHHAHQRGVLHRDLKPANILLQFEVKGEGRSPKSDKKDSGSSVNKAKSTADVPKLPQSARPVPHSLSQASPLTHAVPMVADFGLAKHVEEDDGLTQSGTIVGTPSYMAPEQARAEKALTTATDVYSLGAILFELLAGRPPFQSATTLQTVLDVMEKEPVAPRSINPNIDRDLETICLKCLEKDPRKRYGSAEELADDLDRWLGGEPILARPVSGSERLWRWCRRKPLISGLVLAVLLLLLGGIGVSTYFAVESSRRADDAENERVRANREADDARLAKNRANQKAEDALREFNRAQAEMDRAKEFQALSLFGHAQALRYSSMPGRRQEGLLKLIRAEELCSRVPHERTASERRHGNLPKLPGKLELRNEAVALLLDQDANLVRRIPTTSNADVIFSSDGLLAAWAWYNVSRNDPENSKEGCEVLDLGTGRSARWEVPLTTSHFQGVVRPDKKLIVSLKTGTEQPQFRDLWTGNIVEVLDKARDWPTDKDSEKFGIANVPSLTFSPDGRYLACIRNSPKRQEFALWDLKEDKAKIFFSRPQSAGAAWLSFSSSSKLLVFPSTEKTVTLWDLTEDTRTEDIALPYATTGPASFSSDDRLIAFPCLDRAESKPAVIVWDLVGKGARGRIPLSQVVSGKTLAFRPQSSLFAVADKKHIILVDALQGKEMFRFDTGSRVSQFAWQKDGVHLVSFGKKELIEKDAIKIWELSESPPLFSLLPAAEPFSDLEFSGDGRFLALLVSASPRILIVDRKSGKVEREIAPKIEPAAKGTMREMLGAILMRPDGKQIAAHSPTDQEGPRSARVWNVDTGREVFRLVRDDRFDSLAFGPDNHLLASLGSQGKLNVWDVMLGQRLWEADVPAHTRSLLSPNGRFLIAYPVQKGTGIPQFTIWEMPQGRHSGRKIGSFPLDGIPNQLTFSTDGSLLAIHHKAVDPGKGKFGDKGLGVWSLPTGKKMKSWRDVSGDRLALVFSPDNRILAVLDRRDEGFVKLLDVGTGDEIFNWQTSASDMAFTLEGAFLAMIVPNAQDTSTAVQFLDLESLRRKLAEMRLDWKR